MEDKVLSQRWCLLFLPPPASFSTSGSRVVTIEWLKGTSMDGTEARDPAIPTGPAHSRRSPDPRAGLLKVRFLARLRIIGQTHTGWG